MPQSDYDIAGGVIKVVGDGLGGILNIFYPGTGKAVGDSVGKIGEGVAGIDDMGQRKGQDFERDNPADAPVPPAKVSKEVHDFLEPATGKVRDMSTDDVGLDEWFRGERRKSVEPDDESADEDESAPVPDDVPGETTTYPTLGGRTPWLMQMFSREAA